MDIQAEKENLLVAVIPSGIGRQHVVLAPGIGTETERCLVPGRIIYEIRRLHEHGIREHIDIVGKCERLRLRIVSTCATFDYLTFGILHGTAVEKYRDTVTRIVVKEFRTENIMVLVLQLHQRAAELGQVTVHIIGKLVTGQNRLILKDFHIADSENFIGPHIPERGIANEKSVIVQETRRPRNFTVIHPVLFYQFHGLRAQQAYKRIHLTAFFLGRQAEKH